MTIVIATTACSTTPIRATGAKYFALSQVQLFINNNDSRGIELPPMLPTNIDLICLSHLRWGFVFQRPQHLMSRFARERRVFYIEEPIFEDNQRPHLRSTLCPQTSVHVCTPILPARLDAREVVTHVRILLDQMLQQHRIVDYVAWYYTPMARDFAFSLKPKATVYDCMDELSAFAGAPPAMKRNELALFQEADLVFTGGPSLFESKQKQHPSVHLFPSSVDVAHFASAQTITAEPEDQRLLGRPRVGYAGVIDERMDLELLGNIAAMRPDWQLVLLGPVAKINPSTLPQAPNIHYLGIKRYEELPAYFSGWDIGMLPFAINDSTRYISPTKTPEYLAAGLRVISTPIRDVVRPYAELGLVQIAATAQYFVQAAEVILGDPPNAAYKAHVNRFLSQSSWDKTWQEMNKLMNTTYIQKNRVAPMPKSAVARSVKQAEGAIHV